MSLARPTGLVLLAPLYPASCLNAPTGAWCSLTVGRIEEPRRSSPRLNAPTGAWCPLTPSSANLDSLIVESQCIYRCVVLPDDAATGLVGAMVGLNAPTGAWCSLTTKTHFTLTPLYCLNAPTGAWCSLTHSWGTPLATQSPSQCTYRCVVLPDVRGRYYPHYLNLSQCTYRCVVLPDLSAISDGALSAMSQCTYRCVVLPDQTPLAPLPTPTRLNAPTGAWCSLTGGRDG